MKDANTTNVGILLDGREVTIIGAGPGGLTLARLLQRRGANVKVYERDVSSAIRGQGGSLDLHEDSGQRALRAANLIEQFSVLSRPQGQRSGIFDKHGKRLFDMRVEHENQVRPEIDRGALRDLLLGSLKPGTVTWGRALRDIAAQEDGNYRLEFADGSQVLSTLLVGCDGTWSKVRPLVTQQRPTYAGVTLVETHITTPDTGYPAISELVGEGNILALGDNKALMAQRNGDGHIRVYAAFRVLEDWMTKSGIDFQQPDAARIALLGYFQDWSTALTDMLRASDDIFLPRPLYCCPPDQQWSHGSGITLLGDAAHVMPPFTGRGVNMAMLDAVELADCLTSAHSLSVDSAIATYERGMLDRMSKAIRETMASQNRILAPGGPAALVASIREKLSLNDEPQ